VALTARTQSAILVLFEASSTGRVKARQRIGTFAGNGQRRTFTPAVIFFIALAETEGNPDPG
jgi:hypothetical protein